MIWQYTGTELTDYLGLATGSFPTALDAAFNFVAQKDAPNGLCWTSETKFTDTNGVAIKASDRAPSGTRSRHSAPTWRRTRAGPPG